MRAHHQRRLLWIVNAGLGLALAGLGAWYLLDVKAQVADAGYLSPKYAQQALRSYEDQPPANQSALKVPVALDELGEVDQPRFVKNKLHWWWLYSGPVPPAPPEDAKVDTRKKPTVSELSKLGDVQFVIYWPPDDGEEIAAESVLSWKFKDEKTGEFKPGEPIREKTGDPWSIRLVNLKRAPAGGIEIVYEVFDDASTDDMEPKGTSQGFQSIVWGGREATDLEKQGLIVVDSKTGGAAEDGTSGGSADGEGPSASASGNGTGPALGTVDLAEPEAGASAGGRGSKDEVRADVQWDNPTQATVTFNQDTYDYFKGKDADSIAKTIKTQVAKDENGRVIGVAITGLDAKSPASKFDVRPGDVVVSIDGKPVSSRSDIVNIVQGMDPSVSRVTVVIDRRGRKITYVIDPRDPETRRNARYLDNR